MTEDCVAPGLGVQGSPHQALQVPQVPNCSPHSAQNGFRVIGDGPASSQLLSPPDGRSDRHLKSWLKWHGVLHTAW